MGAKGWPTRQVRVSPTLSIPEKAFSWYDFFDVQQNTKVGAVLADLNNDLQAHE